MLLLIQKYKDVNVVPKSTKRVCLAESLVIFLAAYAWKPYNKQAREFSCCWFFM